MRRGEIWWINFDLAVGGEVRRKRPAVIVSNDAANAHLNRVQVVPFMADQLTTVSKLRLMNRAGALSHNDVLKVDHAIKVQLDLYDAPE